jgi:predicted amidohydrolase YtcJ
MQAAVERLTAHDWVYGPDERLTAEQALHAYTAGSAAVTGWGAEKGRLAPGYLADLVLLDDDPTRVDASRIGDVAVLATVLGGEATHDPSGMLDGGAEDG